MVVTHDTKVRGSHLHLSEATSREGGATFKKNNIHKRCSALKPSTSPNVSTTEAHKTSQTSGTTPKCALNDLNVTKLMNKDAMVNQRLFVSIRNLFVIRNTEMEQEIPFWRVAVIAYSASEIQNFLYKNS